MRHQEILEIPELALREAVVNAICHRDYFEKGANVMVEIYDDRLEITNPGGLPKTLKAEDFGKKSVCRNSIIASLLLRADYIEKMGTGISRIRKALKEANCQAPIFEFDTFFTMTFPRVVKEKTREKTRVKTRVKVSEKTSEKILKLIENDPGITIKKMAKSLDISVKGVEWQLNKLKQQKVIRRVSTDKVNMPSHWEITQKMSVKTSVKMPMKILNLLNENGKYTIPELAKNTGVSTRTIERNLKSLQKSRKIRRAGPARGGHWEVIEDK